MRTICIIGTCKVTFCVPMGCLGADKSLVCYASGMINAVLRKTHRFQNVCRFHFFNCGSLQRPTEGLFLVLTHSFSSGI